jgi:hypothetical protein
LPVQFKSLLPGQEGCVFFSGYLNVRKYHYVLVRLGRQAAFYSTTLYYVKAGKGLRWIFTKWDVGVWAGLSWLRIETGGGHL